MQQVYYTIITKILNIKNNLVLKTFFMAINNLIRLNRLILNLLVFSIYLKKIKYYIFILLFKPYAIAIKKTIDEI